MTVPRTLRDEKTSRENEEAIPNPVELPTAPSNEFEWGTPSRLTIEAMKEAQEGKDPLRFNNAKALFDDLDS